MKKRIVFLAILLSICLFLYADDGDQSVSMTSSLERRNQEPLLKPVWEHVLTAVFDDDDTTDVSFALPVNGILIKVILVAPNGSNAVTYQVEIDDNADNEIFDSGEQAETNTYTYNMFEPVSGTIDITIGPSGAIGATNPDILVYLRGI